MVVALKMEPAMATKPDKHPKDPATRGGDLGPTKDAHKQHQPRSTDETLDEALEESFPASDPPAQTVPRTQRDTKGQPGKP
jgi:hypothetical protein